MTWLLIALLGWCGTSALIAGFCCVAAGRADRVAEREAAELARATVVPHRGLVSEAALTEHRRPCRHETVIRSLPRTRDRA